jgi:hypothetical protein
MRHWRCSAALGFYGIGARFLARYLTMLVQLPVTGGMIARAQTGADV